MNHGPCAENKSNVETGNQLRPRLYNLGTISIADANSLTVYGESIQYTVDVLSWMSLE